jgi:hypothetical protein
MSFLLSVSTHQTIATIIKICSGTPDSGNPPQKYLLGQGSIEIMSPEEQTLTDASVEVVNGQTVMKFTKPMVEADQIAVTVGENKMLWANGGESTTIGYHGPTNRSPFTLDLSSGSAPGTNPPPAPVPAATLSSGRVAEFNALYFSVLAAGIAIVTNHMW